KDTRETHDREETRYLPLLQGLSELQFALNIASDAARSRSLAYFDGGSNEAVVLKDQELQRMATWIGYLTDSLYFPGDEPEGHEPMIGVTPLVEYTSRAPKQQSAQMRLRRAAFLCSDVLSALPFLERFAGQTPRPIMMFDVALPGIRVAQVPGHLT